MIDSEQIIQWYPGHMAQAMRKLQEQMKLIDVVIEVIDGRVPQRGSNPALLELIGRRPRLIVLSREDLVDPASTRAWLDYYGKKSLRAVAVNARQDSSYTHASFFVGQLANMARTRSTARAMVVGIPNAGKSRFINGLLKRPAAKVEDKAGVTRSAQWFRVSPNLELMDTPGILVPKIETKEAQWMLAMCGAVPRDHFDPEEVLAQFVAWMQQNKPTSRIPDLETFATARKSLRSGGELDLHNAAFSYIKDFTEGKFGRVSFDSPPSDARG